MKNVNSATSTLLQKALLAATILIFLVTFLIFLTKKYNRGNDFTTTYTPYGESDAYPHIPEEIITSITHCEQYRSQALNDWKWHKEIADTNRFYFRLIGLFTIIFSASIPVILSTAFTKKNIIASVLGMIIAIGTSLNGFYNWNENWAHNRAVQYEYQNIISTWEIDMMKITQKYLLKDEISDNSEALTEIQKITTQLIGNVSSLRSQANTGFFERTSKIPSEANL